MVITNKKKKERKVVVPRPDNPDLKFASKAEFIAIRRKEQEIEAKAAAYKAELVAEAAKPLEDEEGPVIAYDSKVDEDVPVEGKIVKKRTRKKKAE